MKAIKGLLLDIDGVLYVGERPIPGAIESLRKLRERFKVRFITNTTRKPTSEVVKKLKKMGFDVYKDEVFTALAATASFLRERNAKAFFLLTDEAMEEVKDLMGEPPEYVVVGDAHYNFNYDNLNRAFRYLTDGAKLITAAKNRYFKDRDGKLSLDAGPFVKALEFASGKRAKVIGKPSREFFLSAVRSMDLTPQECAVVGDDIEADVLGGMKVGLHGVLVRTGKFRDTDLKKGKPDLLIESIAELSRIFR
ncbi:HAD superfamily hydrolase (TIGR01458 family) [Hydrogenivirga caldilitoris]|uniref:Haloacid dehalogenase-like hydrolase domain-containing protein 2 n=1 Tax=Hydrogenivirga caldilitoris TaxID=246264 RepID=A0A497XTF8_9AQUI|nr:TIGR01458 family HAD-type hydrolase [Hydrogenivirga caldilitoris]RLJ70213.1 HAD superfamily hydrolase (TIGR01458 family) [Hydrogenivirga caldilitoris]